MHYELLLTLIECFAIREEIKGKMDDVFKKVELEKEVHKSQEEKVYNDYDRNSIRLHDETTA